jgi:hypothetical protein
LASFEPDWLGSQRGASGRKKLERVKGIEPSS